MNNQPAEFRGRLEERLSGWGLPAELADEIEEHSTTVTYERGKIIFLRGARADVVFWLLKGTVKLYLPHSNGNRTLVAIAGPGDILGFIESVDANGRRQVLEAQALTKCSVGLFSREYIVQLLRKLDRETMVRLLEHLNSAWSMMFEQHLAFVGSSFRHRLEVVLASLGARFGLDDQRGTLIVPELTQEDLAEMIGSSRPMVSKLIADMTREGRLTRSEQHQLILRKNVRRHLATDSATQPGALPNNNSGGVQRRSDGAKVDDRMRMVAPSKESLPMARGRENQTIPGDHPA
jgi:CRP/FNR family transcriptional regulator, cyclic AMP receptor protein